MPRVLPLSAKAVELMAYMATHVDPADDEIARALWPKKSPERGAQLLVETVAEINRVATEATGDPTPILAKPGAVAHPTARPAHRVLVRVLGTPCVEVYDPGETLPGQDPLDKAHRDLGGRPRSPATRWRG